MGLRTRLRNAVQKVIQRNNQQNAGSTSPEISISIDQDEIEDSAQTPTTARSINASSDGQPLSGRSTRRSSHESRASIDATKSGKFGRRRSRSARPRGSGKSVSLSPNKQKPEADNSTNLRVETSRAAPRSSTENATEGKRVRKSASVDPMDDGSSPTVVLTARSIVSSTSTCSGYSSRPAISPSVSTSSRSPRPQSQANQRQQSEEAIPQTARSTTSNKSTQRERPQRAERVGHQVSPPTTKKASGAAAAALPEPATPQLKPRTPRAAEVKTSTKSKSIEANPTTPKKTHHERISPRVAPSSSRSATSSCPPQSHQNPSTHPRSITRAQTQVVECGKNGFESEEEEYDDDNMSDEVRTEPPTTPFKKRAVSEDSSVFSTDTSITAASVDKDKLREQRKEKTKRRVAAASRFAGELVVQTVSAVIASVV